MNRIHIRDKERVQGKGPPLYTTVVLELGALVKRSKKGNFSLAVCLFTQIHFPHQLSTWLTTLRWCFDRSYVQWLWLLMYPMWNDYDLNASLSTIMKHTYHKNFKLSFKHRMWILCEMTTSMNASLLLSFPPWSLTLRMAGLHKLKILWAWRSVKLSIVWTSDESLPIPSIKLPKIASLSSQFEH